MSKKKTHKEYVLQVADLNPNIEVLGVYDGNKHPIEHKCKKCGCVWKTQPLHIIQGHGCPDCAKLQRPISNTMSHETFTTRATMLYPDIEILGIYTGTHKTIKVRCKTCGHIWHPKASCLLVSQNTSGGTGCKQCYTNRQTKNINVFKSELYKKNINIKLIGEYINSYTKTLFKCYECEKQCEWSTTPASVLSGHKSSMCTMSNGVVIIKKFLDNHSIAYTMEQTFEKCKNVYPLRFDFYLPEYNCCIEYDGEQHYSPVNFHGCSDIKSDMSFQQTKFNDIIKNEYCISNNINLLRIPFFELNNIENILCQHLLVKAGDAQ